MRKLAKKGQKPANQEARKGEGDRRVLNLRPKHLFRYTVGDTVVGVIVGY